MWHTLEDSVCELGESPFWHPEEQSLYWIDIAGRAVLRTRGHIETATIERWALPAEPGCMAPARSGGLVIALRDGIYRARTWNGPLVRIASADYDTRTLRFNDGKCDPRGRFWAGTLNEAKDAPSAVLYCLDARAGGTPGIVPMASDVTTANGLAFSPDQQTLYWADTAAHVVRAWDWDADANALSAPRVFHQFDPKPQDWVPGSGVPYAGRPDGATLDIDGCYWVAMFEGAQLLRLSPDGRVLDAVPVPVQCPTMPCFGGDDLRTLFVTSARRGRPQSELVLKPASGAIVATRVATPGLPVHFFED